MRQLSTRSRHNVSEINEPIRFKTHLHCYSCYSLLTVVPCNMATICFSRSITVTINLSIIATANQITCMTRREESLLCFGGIKALSPKELDLLFLLIKSSNFVKSEALKMQYRLTEIIESLYKYNDTSSHYTNR